MHNQNTTYTTDTPPHWTFYIFTFGCRVNQYESQSIREAWKEHGGIECSKPEQAKIILINSCAITAKAESEIKSTIFRLEKLQTSNTIILTGCAALLSKKNINQPSKLKLIIPCQFKTKLLQNPFKLLNDADLITKMEQSSFIKNSKLNIIYPEFTISTPNKARPVLKIQEGCSHRCTYCIVPLMRGHTSSRNPVEVLAEAKRLLEFGCREIVISGINLAQYKGFLDKKFNFWDLIVYLEKELFSQWHNIARLRISSLEPGQLNEQGIDVLANSQMLCPHLHISLQSGSEKILKLMGRSHYCPEQLVKAINTLQNSWKFMGLGADFLMGFPSEDDQDVLKTMEIIQALPLTYAHVFPYSQRPQTIAATMPNQISTNEKAIRASTIRNMIKLKSLEFYEKIQNIQTDVILDGANSLKGVNEYYVNCHFKSDVDKQKKGKIIIAKCIGIKDSYIEVEPA